MKRLIVFDLDGTLAPSKSSLAPQTAGLLRDLLGIVKVAVISGGAWEQFEKQLLTDLPKNSLLANLSLLPTCGTKFFRYEGKWAELYSEDLTAEQKKKIIDSLDQAAEKAGYRAKKIWGEVIEDRGSQVTYSALGQQAPLAEKEKWDADFAKSIDKAYGIKKLRDTLHLSLKEMIYIGDALFPGGNDYPAEEEGVVSIPVKGPDDTNLVIHTILACLGEK
jgi:phosphomannomutase